MRKLKLFLTLLMLMCIGITQMWGAIDANSTWTATAFADIPDGATVIIINNFGRTLANATVTKAPAKVEAAFNSTTKKITVTGKTLDEVAWTVEQATNGKKFWVYGSTTNLLGVTKDGDNNAVGVGSTTSVPNNELVLSGLLKPYNLTRFIGEYVGGSDWRSYNSATANNYKSSGTNQALTFYVLDAAPTDPFTVTLMDNNATLTEESAGAGVTLPSRDGCEGYTFVGWTNTWTAAQSSWTTEAPEIIPAGAYHPTADENLYPVYTKVEVSSGSGFTGYTQIAFSGTITDGQYLISTGSFTMAGSGKTGASFTPGSTEKTEYEYTISVDGDYFTILGPDNKYVGSGTGTGLIFDNSASEDTYKWEYVSTGILNKSNTTRHIRAYNTSDFRNYTTSNGTDTYLYKRTEGGSSSTTYYISEPSCCTKRAISIASGITNGSISADLAEACEGVTVTITFSPDGGYHLDSWSVNGTAQDVAANTFLMPAAAATVSAVFEHDPCSNLLAPTLNGAVAVTYNSATINWNAAANASSYDVAVVRHSDSESIFSGNLNDLTKALAGLDPETQYDYSIMAVGDGVTYCTSGNGVLAGNFTTDPLPTAKLTLKDPSGTHASSGDYTILTPFNLPATAASCAKAFVGWDEDPDCATAPHYAKGAVFTFANTTGVTLYAVYADETPGAASLTKMTSSDALANGDKIIVVAKGTKFGLYQETVATSYVKNWSYTGDAPAVADLDDAKKVWDVTADETNWKLGDATNGFLYMNPGGNELYVKTNGDASAWVVAWNTTNSAFTIKTGTRYLSCRTDLTSSNKNYYRGGGTGTTTGTAFFDVYKYAVGASTFSNYSTTCVASPTAEPASASIEVAAAGASSTLGVTYENVNLANVAVALYNDAACTEEFDGGWLIASIAGDDKHIAYTAQENTSYNDVRTAYIKLTAPETSGAADPAVVVIPVEQARKPAVFGNLADLVAANVNSGIQVTVTFEEVITNDQTISGPKRAGLFLTTTAGSSNKAIEVFYNKNTTVVPAEWLIGGKLSATSMTFTWTLFNSDQWELVPLGNDWTWDNGDLTYTAPKAVSSVVITGAPTKTAYVDGELFKPAGLTVTVNYTVGEPEVNPVGVTFACDPERVAKSENPVSVNVVATFNEVSSAAFPVNVTVGDIQLKTVQEFITAGNADMRCYLEGTVSNYTNTTKGYFDLTDESASIYIYGCDAPSSFAAGDKIKVIAEDYDYYNSKHEAKNVVFVSKKPVATMTFDPMEMETGDEAALAPKTITLAEASAVAYSIKDGSDDCVTIDNENKKITATAAGSATIVATLAETADYVGATVEFAVTVTAPDLRSIANSPAEFDAVSGDLDPTDIKFAAYKGDGTTEPATTSNSYIRLYKPASGKTTGGYLTLTALMGFKIDQVQITFDGNATASYAVDNDAFSTEAYITGQASLLTPAGLEAQSVTIVNLKSGSIDIKAIKVWYGGEALAIHHYILGGTYETTFEQNTTFSYEGLTVTAAYDELETITEPITDFTVVADLSEAGPATASVRRNDAEIATYAITVTPGKANPNLAYTPNELEVAAADVASWVAPEFSNPLEVSPITYSSNKTAVAKVTSDGVITLQGGYGTAVITASFAGNDDYIASQATYTITVNEPVDDIKGHWVATNAVQAGMEIIIANVVANGNVKTMGAQNSNNRAAVASTVNEQGVLSPANGTKIFTLVDAGNGNYNIKAVNNNYLYAASGSSNHLKEEATPDANHNADWAISFANGKATIIAQGNNARNWMRYNSDNNIFSCYASGQEDIVIYAISEEVKDGEVIDASSLREDEDIVINGTASMTINDEVSLGDIHVKAGDTLNITASADATLGNLDLENGAVWNLNITPGTTVAANDLILRSNSADRDAQEGKSSQAPGVLPVINGVLALEIDLRPELAADATLSVEQSEMWYCISAPFEVDINSGFEWVYPDGHRTPMVHNVDFQIFEYDGARHATGLSGWKRIGGTMKAGVAHFIGFDNARTNQKVIRLTAKTNVVVDAEDKINLGSYPGVEGLDNWNGVANPTLQYIGIDKPIVAFDYGIQDYNTYAADDYNYFVGSPFFIQQDGGSIAIDYNDRGGAIHAPKRAEDKLDYCVRINAAGANCFDCQMYVRASETASNSYEEGHDLASQCSTTPKYGARIWTENYNLRLGIEEAPLVNGNASYVLGIATPAAGEYTISVAAPKENADLYLTYNGSIIWNLSNGAYTVDLAKGVTSGYGLVMQAKAPQVITGIDNAEANEAGVQKVIINNHVYILRAEQMYDVTGKMVK